MKTLKALLTVFVVVLVLRGTVLWRFVGYGVWIDVAAIATVLWAMSQGAPWGSTLGFMLGLALDLDAGHWLGRHALVLSMLGYVIGQLSRTLVRDSVRTQFLLIAGGAAIHQLCALPQLADQPSEAWLTWAIQNALWVPLTALVGVVLLFLLRLLRGRPLFDDVTISGYPTP